MSPLAAIAGLPGTTDRAALSAAARHAGAAGAGVIVVVGKPRVDLLAALADGLVEPARVVLHVLAGAALPPAPAGIEIVTLDDDVGDAPPRVDLLVVTAGLGADAIRDTLTHWLPRLHEDGGLVAVEDHVDGHEVAAGVSEAVPFAWYQQVARPHRLLVLRRQREARRLVLCGGMQSSGSSLVSWCFLQRGDMDGVYDLHNPLIQQDFAAVRTAIAWVKMTIGAFRLDELVAFYTAQGWQVSTLLVTRGLADVLGSLRGKDYGFDGSTSDDPPLYLRARRYAADLARAREAGWVILDYEALCAAPVASLQATCAALDLPWDEAMTHWPKALEDIAYPGGGSPTLNATRGQAGALVDTVRRYEARGGASSAPVTDPVIARAIAAFEHGTDTASLPPLPPVPYRDSHRHRLERELAEARRDLARLGRHPVFGPLLRLWRRLVNRDFPDCS